MSSIVRRFDHALTTASECRTDPTGQHCWFGRSAGSLFAAVAPRTIPTTRRAHWGAINGATDGRPAVRYACGRRGHGLARRQGIYARAGRGGQRSRQRWIQARHHQTHRRSSTAHRAIEGAIERQGRVAGGPAARQHQPEWGTSAVGFAGERGRLRSAAWQRCPGSGAHHADGRRRPGSCRAIAGSRSSSTRTTISISASRKTTCWPRCALIRAGDTSITG